MVLSDQKETNNRSIKNNSGAQGQPSQMPLHSEKESDRPPSVKI